MLAGNKEVSIFAARLKQNGTYIEGMSKVRWAWVFKKEEKVRIFKNKFGQVKNITYICAPKNEVH